MVIVYLLATPLSSPPVEPITLNNRGEVEEQTDGRRRRGCPDARRPTPDALRLAPAPRKKEHLLHHLCNTSTTIPNGRHTTKW